MVKTKTKTSAKDKKDKKDKNKPGKVALTAKTALRMIKESMREKETEEIIKQGEATDTMGVQLLQTVKDQTA